MFYNELSIFATMSRIATYIGLLFIMAGFEVNAQYRWDFGAYAGVANYLGDIGGAEGERRDFLFDMKLNRTNRAFGGFARYKISPQFAVNTGFMYGRIRGNDYNSQNPARVARNLSFRNDIYELSTRLEFTIFYDSDVGGRGYYNPDFKMFVFLGAGVMYHNPKARYYGDLEEFNDELVELQPLQTEGVDYGLWQFTLPAGVGLFFTHKKVHRFGWEIGWRSTFTDYLDDVSTNYVDPSELPNQLAVEMANRTDEVSLATAAQYAEEFGLDVPNAASFAPGEQRGLVTNNDGYLFTQVSYSYVIKGRSSFYKKRYSWIKSKKRKRRKSRAKF
jgi:hypothetical protein